MPKFSIVMVNTNSGNLLAESIDSFMALNLKNDDFEFIVVDNGSSDDSLSRVRWGNLDRRIIINKSDYGYYGYPRGVNQGVAESRGEYIVLLNPDTRLLNDIFSLSEDIFAKDSSIGICGPAKYYPDGTEQLSCLSFPSVTRQLLLILGITDFLARNKNLVKILCRVAYFLPDSAKIFLANFDNDGCSREAPWLVDSCSIIRKKVMDAAGPYEEKALYVSDLEFSMRVRKAGYKIYYNPKAKIIHYGSWKRFAPKRQEQLCACFTGLDYFYRRHYRGIRKAALILLNKLDSFISYVFTPKTCHKMHCFACGSLRQVRFIEHHAPYRIFECLLCGGQSCSPIDISGQDYGRWYEGKSGRDISYESFVALHPGRALEIYRDNPYIKLTLRLMGEPGPDVKLLDIGCSQGAFCRIAKDRGFEVYGVEPSEKAAEYAKTRMGIENTVRADFENIPAGWHSFDIVTALEVIEHVDRPDNLIGKAYGLLRPGGHFLLSTPNNDSLEVMLGRRNRRDYPPHHLTRWRKKTIKLILERAGFRNVRIESTPVDRAIIGSIFLPRLLEERGQLLDFPVPFEKKEISAAKKAFLLSWLWVAAQRAGDLCAFFLNLIFFNRGSTLVALAEKPEEK